MIEAPHTLPAVSVLLPVYNAARYLEAAICSVLEQTYTNFELVCVDDGSADESLPMLRRFETSDARVRVLSRPNTGIVGALNDAAAMARAPLLARMDADDIALPQRLTKQVAYMAAHPECVLLGSRVLLIDPEGLPICEWATEQTHEEIDSAHLNLKWPMVHPAIIMRREALLAVGGYRKTYDTLEDLDLFLRMAEYGRIANLPDVLLHYRQHFGSTCFMRGEKQSSIREALYRECHARRGLPFDRPAESFRAVPRSVAHEHVRWAWLALGAGHVRTARKYALRLLGRHPMRSASWRLAWCAARGY